MSERKCKELELEELKIRLAKAQQEYDDNLVLINTYQSKSPGLREKLNNLKSVIDAREEEGRVLEWSDKDPDNPNVYIDDRMMVIAFSRPVDEDYFTTEDQDDLLHFIAKHRGWELPSAEEQEGCFVRIPYGPNSVNQILIKRKGGE